MDLQIMEVRAADDLQGCRPLMLRKWLRELDSTSRVCGASAEGQTTLKRALARAMAMIVGSSGRATKKACWWADL